MRYLAIPLILLLILSGCTRKQEAGGVRNETRTKTAWTPKSEIFVEYEEPVAGKSAGFLIHVTNLKDFKPLADGAVTLTFSPESGDPAEITVGRPDKPGIYKAEVLLTRSGDYSVRLRLSGPALADEIALGDIQVNGGASHTHSQEGERDSAEIVFRKEQQWGVEFMTGMPMKRDVEASLIVPGEFVPAARSDITVSAPLSGSISSTRQVPYVGKRVTKGEVLAVLEPPPSQHGGAGQLSAAYAEARQREALAQKEVERAQRLYEVKAVPKRRVEEAEVAVESARAVLEPLERATRELRDRGSNGRVPVSAPIAGTVVEMFTAGGKGIEAGQPILRVVNTDTLWLRAHVPATAVGSLKDLARSTFTVPGMDGVRTPSRLVSVNDLVDPKSRTVAVLFEVPNPGGTLKSGMFADVAVSTGVVKDVLTLPGEALFEDEGRSFAYVQHDGESFERREVKTGLRGNGLVQITGGLEKDERVVLRGGYYVKLASLSARVQDPHAGHSH